MTHRESGIEATKPYGAITLLYVEDETLLREEVSIYLSRRVGHLIQATNGEEALAILKENPVDAIMTDLLMPKMDGITLLNEVRGLYPKIPFVITTAINDFKIMQEAIQLGVTRFLIKPFETAQIDEALSAIKDKCEALKSEGEKQVKAHYVKAQLSKAETEIAKLLKETTHKGPSRVSINVCANLTEVVVEGGYTKMELTLLENQENQKFVDYFRGTYYQAISPDIKRILKMHFACYHSLLQVSCSSKQQLDILKWITD